MMLFSRRSAKRTAIAIFTFILCIASFITLTNFIRNLAQPPQHIIHIPLTINVSLLMRRALETTLLGNAERGKVIHQTWKASQLPGRFKTWSLTWKRCFPGWKYILWTDEDNEDFIQVHYPWFMEKYRGFSRNIERVDAVRYFYLYHYGGVYADLDAECLRPHTQLFHNVGVALGSMDHPDYPKGYTQNSYMFSTRGHPFWIDVITEILSRSTVSGGAVEYSTGPNLLMDVITQKHDAYKNLTVFAPWYFNPFSWYTNTYRHCKNYDRMSDEDVGLCKEHYNRSYVIQYHTQVWRFGWLCFYLESTFGWHCS